MLCCNSAERDGKGRRNRLPEKCKPTKSDHPEFLIALNLQKDFIVVQNLWTIGKWSKIKRTGTRQHNRVTLRVFRRALCKVYTVVSFFIDVGPQRTLAWRLPPLDKI